MLNDKELELLNKIQRKKMYEDKFFEKRGEIKWFDELKKRGYFNPNLETAPQESKDKGIFFIPQWNVLPYLEKVSQKVNILENKKYIDELLSIIKNVTEYHIKHNKILDNYRTWWYFVKILCNLPNEKINDEIISLIPIWLDSRFDNTLPAKEILEKLLPKFLKSDDPDNLRKAENIVDIVTEIKWLPKYTEQHKKEIREKYKNIFDKPEEQRTEEEKREIAVFGLDEEEPKTIIDIHSLTKSFINNKVASKVGEKCSESVIFKLADKLKSIFEKEQPSGRVDLSGIWFSSLFITPNIYDTRQIITLILREMLLAKAKKDINITKTIFNKFLSEDYKYPLFKRLVLFVIGTEWQSYQDIFWNMINEDENGDFFNDPDYEAEIYTILQKYGNQFSSIEKEKIKNIIEAKVPDKPHPEGKYREYYSAYQKQKWYSALKADNYFASLYEKYKNITKKEEEINFKEPEVRVGPGPSPLSKETILKMSNEELAEYLKTFKTVDFWKGPTIGGLSDILKDAVEEKPEKFIDDLNPFLKTGYLYVYDILYGTRAAWEKRKIINWGKLFNFIKDYISSEDFWNDNYRIEGDEWKVNHLWVIGMIGDLIRQGTVDDDWAFSEEHFKIAQEILFKILGCLLKEKEKILSEDPVRNDPVGYALNSTFGRITEALFMLALRIKRIEEKTKIKQEVSWEFSIKGKYEELLNNEIIESYVWLGRYLANFYYMDKEWTENKIKTITIEKGQLWEAFMDGYLFGSNFYYDLYKLMETHYNYAINYQFKEKLFSDRLVQHICIGYLSGIEDIKDNNSLFRKLLDKWDISQIEELIDFFWMQRKDYEQKPDKSVVLDKDGKPKVIEHQQEQEQPIEDEEMIKIENKIIDFWRWVYENKYKGKKESELNNEDKKILSEFCNLTVFLPEINSENFEWLKISAQSIDNSFHSSFFIEYLNNLKDKGQSVDFVGKVYIEMLKNATPYFMKEDIWSIVEFLYQKGKKEEADEICVIYCREGYEFLKPLYMAYNKSQ